MSAIINAAESLSLEHKVSIAQTKAQSGRRVAQKRGPVLYNLEVQVGTRSISGQAHKDIQDEIIDLGYGAETLLTKLPTQLTGVRDSWTSSNLVSATGTEVVLSTVVGNPTKGDYFQLSGSTKVYQIASYDASTTTITSNCAILGSNSTITIGDQVVFNFALMEKPRTNYLPGNLVQYGVFKLEEVL